MYAEDNVDVDFRVSVIGNKYLIWIRWGCLSYPDGSYLLHIPVKKKINKYIIFVVCLYIFI